jgi:hypothetical protein
MKNGQPVLERKLHLILHRAFVEARNLALSERRQQLFDLADTFEILPSLMDHWEEGRLDQVKGILESYQGRYKEMAYDYLSILNMADAAFEEVFRSW